MKEWVKCYKSDVLINSCVCERGLKIEIKGRKEL